MASSDLVPLVHEFLVSSGYTKTAKKLASESGVDVTADRKDSTKLLDIYNQHVASAPKSAKRKAPVNDEASEPVAKKAKKQAAAEEPAAAEAEPVATKSKKKKAADAEEEEATPAAAAEEPKKDKKQKKAKTVPAPAADEDGAAEAETAAEPNAEDAEEGDASNGAGAGAGASGRKGRGAATPFQRVKAEEIEFLPQAMRDNSFQEDVLGRGTEWGKKANDVLGAVKGKGFRHEKTKKKRGTYRGGALETGVRSIKFT